MSRGPTEFVHYPAELAALAPFGPYRAVITHVVDGDTIGALCDLGFNDYRYLVIRLAGIDAPELFTGTDRGAGAAARDHLAQLVAQHGPWCVIRSGKWQQSFGRYIGWVSLVDGTDLAERMVTDGHATRSD